MIKDTASREPAPARPAPLNTDHGPLTTEVLIHAARMRAQGISWKTIAARTPHTAADLGRLPFDHPEIWEPLYKHAEKLALQEAEGQMFKALNVLLEGEDVHAAEKAARELLVHRRHIERRRRRYLPQRTQSTQREAQRTELGSRIDSPDSAEFTAADNLDGPPCDSVSSVYSVVMSVGDPPEELRVPIIQLACCRAQGEDLLSTAAEIGYHHEEVERWPFLYARAWDRCWRTARLETARFYAARAIRKLTDLAFDPDRNLAARAARTLLVHRRHMHWAQTNQPPNRAVESVGEGAGTYPSSLAQAVVAIPGAWRVATDVLSARGTAKVNQQEPPRPRPTSQAAGPRETDVGESTINRREHKVGPDTGSRARDGPGQGSA